MLHLMELVELVELVELMMRMCLQRSKRVLEGLLMLLKNVLP